MDIQFMLACNSDDILEIKNLLDKKMYDTYNLQWLNLSATSLFVFKYIIEYCEKSNIKIDIHIMNDTMILEAFIRSNYKVVEYIIYLSKYNYGRLKECFCTSQIIRKQNNKYNGYVLLNNSLRHDFRYNLYSHEGSCCYIIYFE